MIKKVISLLIIFLIVLPMGVAYGQTSTPPTSTPTIVPNYTYPIAGVYVAPQYGTFSGDLQNLAGPPDDQYYYYTPSGSSGRGGFGVDFGFNIPAGSTIKYKSTGSQDSGPERYYSLNGVNWVLYTGTTTPVAARYHVVNLNPSPSTTIGMDSIWFEIDLRTPTPTATVTPVPTNTPTPYPTPPSIPTVPPCNNWYSFGLNLNNGGYPVNPYLPIDTQGLKFRNESIIDSAVIFLDFTNRDGANFVLSPETEQYITDLDGLNKVWCLGNCTEMKVLIKPKYCQTLNVSPYPVFQDNNGLVFDQYYLCGDDALIQFTIPEMQFSDFPLFTALDSLGFIENPATGIYESTIEVCANVKELIEVQIADFSFMEYIEGLFILINLVIVMAVVRR